MRITIRDIDQMLRDGIDIITGQSSPALLAVQVFAWKHGIKPDDVTPRQAKDALKAFTYCVKHDLQPNSKATGSSSSSSKKLGAVELLDSIFHLAGVIGIDPRDLTVREISQMAKAHQKKEPTIKGQSKVPVGVDNLSLLKSVFVKGDSNANQQQGTPFQAKPKTPPND
jgi:hypothetical protein